MNPELDPENRKIFDGPFLLDKQEKEVSLKRLVNRIAGAAVLNVLERFQKEERYQSIVNDILNLNKDSYKLELITYELAKTLENELLVSIQKSDEILVPLNDNDLFILRIKEVGFSDQSRRRKKEISNAIIIAKEYFPQVPDEFLKAIEKSPPFQAIYLNAYEILPEDNVTVPEMLNHLPYRLRDLNLNALQILEFYRCRKNRIRVINHHLSLVFITYYNKQYHVCNIFPDQNKKLCLRLEPYHAGRVLNYSRGNYPHLFIMPKRTLT